MGTEVVGMKPRRGGEGMKGVKRENEVKHSINLIKVLMVDMCVYSEQTLENCLCNDEKILRKWNTCIHNNKTSLQSLFKTQLSNIYIHQYIHRF